LQGGREIVDELTTVGSTNYTYTGDGQEASQGTTSLTWDGSGRLKTDTVASNTITYTYDPTGALLTRASSSPATTTNYLLGDLFETNNSGTITTSYADGPAGNLASFNGPPTGTATFLYYDAHGNLAAEANTSGTQTANHTYDPFGAPNDSVPTNQTTHRFVGRWNKQYDTATSLILMGARPYDPTTGRFLSVDPIPGGSLNNYDYAGQDPIDNYDLNGQTKCRNRFFCTVLPTLHPCATGFWCYLIHKKHAGDVSNSGPDSHWDRGRFDGNDWGGAGDGATSGEPGIANAGNGGADGGGGGEPDAFRYASFRAYRTRFHDGRT
jgi:RHS repeat-associated protein